MVTCASYGDLGLLQSPHLLRVGRGAWGQPGICADRRVTRFLLLDGRLLGAGLPVYGFYRWLQREQDWVSKGRRDSLEGRQGRSAHHAVQPPTALVF